MAYKEIISCADGGPEPLWGMDPETAYYVGIYDGNGTILCEFFDNETAANIAFNRIPLPQE